MQILFVARKPLRRSSTSEAQASIVECDFVGARRNPLPRSCMSDVQKCRAFCLCLLAQPCAGMARASQQLLSVKASRAQKRLSAKASLCKSISGVKAFVCNS